MAVLESTSTVPWEYDDNNNSNDFYNTRKNYNQPANRRDDLIEATCITSIDSATGKGVNICATLRKGDQTTGHPSIKMPRSSEKQRDMKYLINRLEVLHMMKKTMSKIAYMRCIWKNYYPQYKLDINTRNRIKNDHMMSLL